MLQRFVAASAVASVVIAFAAVILRMMPVPDSETRLLLTTLWCMVPAVWGVWALLAPAGWVAQRLSHWGALLGIVAGILAAFMIDIPGRFAGGPVAVWAKALAVIIAVGLYYLLWMVVGRVHQALVGPQS